MPKIEPFVEYVSLETLLGIVKNLEKRWGIALVSFLPSNAQERIVQLQYDIAKLWNGQSKDVMRQSRSYIKFYEPKQFHCTHITLTRSTPNGPVLGEAFVRKGHRISELYEQIEQVTSQMQPIQIELDSMRVAHDGLGIVLLGQCSNENSIESRRRLLKELNKKLPTAFNVSFRSWDSDSSQFYKVHTALGYLKRPLPQTYQTFVKQIKNIKFTPITFTVASVSLVQHKYRSLAFPQEGIVAFPLGKKAEITADKFASSINLA